MIPFGIAAGSVAGREHRLAGRNSQDAFAIMQRTHILTAFACDGCGSSPHSEVGANLGARLLAEYVGNSLATLPPGRMVDHEVLQAHCEFARQDVLAHLRVLTRQLGGSYVRAVTDYFLFTAIGFIITPAFVAVVAAGDGLYIVNGSAAQLGPYPGNAPPYLAYGLLDTKQFEGPTPTLDVVAIYPACDVQSGLIGTDGAFDLQAKCDRRIPGTADVLGSIGQFWEKSVYFTNPDALRRRLTVIGNDVTQLEDGEIVKSPGLLHDDTTLIVLQRKEG